MKKEKIISGLLICSSCCLGKSVSPPTQNSSIDEESKIQLTKEAISPRLKILTKKPIIPSEKEVELNKRARSGKLRIAQLN